MRRGFYGGGMQPGPFGPTPPPGRFHTEAPQRPELNHPPNSRLFIIQSAASAAAGGQQASKEQLEEAFGKYGTVEKVDMVAHKGIAYVKFNKTSAAADALEALDGTKLENGAALKVVVAAPAGRKNGLEDGAITSTRLFLTVPKSWTDDELRQEFEVWGVLDYVRVVRDRNTDESRGIGYVQYLKFSQAARAFEEADPKFKARFADKTEKDKIKDASAIGKSRRGGYEGGFGPPGYGRGAPGVKRGFGPERGGFGRGRGGYGGESGYGGGMGFEATNNPNVSGTCNLAVCASSTISENDLWNLFNLMPGLQTCNLNEDYVTACVAYSTPNEAAYAMEKLHGFEFQGVRILVKFDDDSFGADGLPPDVQGLVSTIQHATNMLKASGYGSVAKKVKLF